MRKGRPARTRVALVDLQLADCDRLRSRLGPRLQVSLVVAPTGRGPLARWAEVSGYPWATDLEALTAVIADAVAVGAGSRRRAEALSLARALGARPVLLGDEGRSAPAPAALPAVPAAPTGLDDALRELFPDATAGPPPPDPWSAARDAGFRAGLLWSGSPEGPFARRYGEPADDPILIALARRAAGAPRGWLAAAACESGYWEAWCARARSGGGPAVALGGRLLGEAGYGPPTERSPAQHADREIAERVLEAAGFPAGKKRR